MKASKLAMFAFLFLTMIVVSAQEHLTHSKWTTLVQKYVDDKGFVNYPEFKKDEKKLDEYLAVLSRNHPNDSWDRNDQLAYWINAYNAFTVKLILKNYPVKSIKDLGGSLYKINTPWDIKFIEIEDQTYDLNNIEHGIIRKDFDEPRIHFAVNCASISCPPLRKEAYTGADLGDQLDDQARIFINDPSKNRITSEKAELSRIFKWFSGDFGNVLGFVNYYTGVKITGDTEVDYLEYDWGLNESGAGLGNP